jgi:diguanylate cyclase (GGDEF)-like protein
MAEIRSGELGDSDAGLFSLSQIMHLMRVEFGRAQRYSYALSVLVIGVDRLGHLRDLYGYDAKEAILDEVARLLQSETRTCDFLGRMMDDRLLAVIPHTDAAGSAVLGQRLIGGVKALKFESGPRELQVTISIGAASMAGNSTLFFDTLTTAAEGALAQAVDAGGDRFVARDPAPAAR